VSNRDYLQFVDAGGYASAEFWSQEAWAWREAEHIEHPLFWTRRDDRWFWRGMFEEVPLPPAWPVYVSQFEAAAYARWAGGRLPTEAEYQRAAYGSPGGAGEPGIDVAALEPERANFDFVSWDPRPVGTYPEAASSWGVEDLIGNGWEWTSTVFAGFPGFQPLPSYPEYSADFFDGQHCVMKGASPATARELVRPSFRNWFRPNYPYVYAKFRCVR
jgi:formylglycine-generating enzyme required for sulfatase activity